MKLFGPKKGSESLRSLTEREIQDKLYGRFRSPHRVSEEDTPAANNKKQEVISKPVVTSYSMSDDMFPSKTSTLEKKQERFSPPPPEKKEYTRNKFNPSSTAPSKPSNFNLNFLKPIAGTILKFVFSLVAGVFNFILSLDFRKPAVRKTFYTIASVGLLFAIFLGIHFLNVSREAAMKAPHKSSAAAPPVVEAVAEEESPITPVKPDEKKSAAAKTAAAQESDSEETVPAAAAPVATTETAEGRGAYAIQIATFATQQDANRLLEQLKAESLRGFVRPLTHSGGRRYFCVFIGRFASFETAQHKLAEFRKKEISKPFHDAFIRSL